MSVDYNQAMIDFKRGVRPTNYKPAKSWFVIGPDDELYPAKAIYALAHNIRAATINTKDVVEELERSGHKLIKDDSVSPSYGDLEDDVEQALELSEKELEEKAKSAPKKPKKITTTTVQFQRDPYVIAHALKRANGKCEKCEANAPFVRSADQSPYLEVHHKITLANGGDDSIDNTIALCPNCHREMHFG